MAVTRLKRKDRRNKTVSRDRKHLLKSFAALSFTKPVHTGVHAEPEAEDDSANTAPVEQPQAAAALVAETSVEAPAAVEHPEASAVEAEAPTETATEEVAETSTSQEKTDEEV